MAVTGLSIVTAAFELGQVYQPGEAVSNSDAESARGILNRMLGTWAKQTLTIPAITRFTSVLTSGKGGPSNVYTIGIGANLNTAKPPTQEDLLAATWYLTGTTPINEIPITTLTDSEYASLTTKELAGAQPTQLWYNPTYLVSGWGSIHLFPVPNTSTGTLVLYLQQALSRFADLTTSYELPDEGTEDAIVTNLTRRLAKPFGFVADADLIDQAETSLRVLKRGNVKFCDMANYFTTGPGRYDITTGDYR